MTRVKICGITTSDDRDAAVRAGAHALGFTVDVPVDTPREITPDHAATLIADVPPFVTTVLVTIPRDAKHALDLLATTNADAIQIHGDLPPHDLATIHTTGAHHTILALDPTHSDPTTIPVESADAIIIDSAREHGAGGTGEPTDWTAARSLTASLDRPVILAGGLTPDNVATAIETVRPYAVDVASGVEQTGGRKDPDLVRRFIATATTTTPTPNQ